MSVRFPDDAKEQQAAVYWNGHLMSPVFQGDLSFSQALAWAEEHLPVQEVCSMTVKERTKTCCASHPPHVW